MLFIFLRWLLLRKILRHVHLKPLPILFSTGEKTSQTAYPPGLPPPKYHIFHLCCFVFFNVNADGCSHKPSWSRCASPQKSCCALTVAITWKVWAVCCWTVMFYWIPESVLFEASEKLLFHFVLYGIKWYSWEEKLPDSMSNIPFICLRFWVDKISRKYY